MSRSGGITLQPASACDVHAPVARRSVARTHHSFRGREVDALCIAALMSGYGLEPQSTDQGDAAIDEATLRLLEARSFIRITLIEPEVVGSQEPMRHEHGRTVPVVPTRASGIDAALAE
jgi:hypothetical protein